MSSSEIKMKNKKEQKTKKEQKKEKKQQQESPKPVENQVVESVPVEAKPEEEINMPQGYLLELTALSTKQKIFDQTFAAHFAGQELELLFASFGKITSLLLNGVATPVPIAVPQEIAPQEIPQPVIEQPAVVEAAPAPVEAVVIPKEEIKQEDESKKPRIAEEKKAEAEKKSKKSKKPKKSEEKKPAAEAPKEKKEKKEKPAPKEEPKEEKPVQETPKEEKPEPKEEKPIVPAEPTNRIFVGKLPQTCNVEDLKKKFSEFGEIKSNDRQHGGNKSKKPAAYMHVIFEYATIEQAQQAIDSMNGQEFEGAVIVVERAKSNPRPKKEPRQPREQREHVEPKEYKEGKQEERAPRAYRRREERPIREKKPIVEQPSNSKVFIRQLPVGVTDEEVKNMFKAHGDINYCKVIPTKIENPISQCAKIEFKNPTMAFDCIMKANGAHFKDNRIRVDYYEERQQFKPTRPSKGY